MPEIYNLEQSLSEQLDDLLVENKIESSRQSRLIFPEFGMGMIVSVKDPVRINLKLEIYPNETEEPHFKVTYQNTTCRFKLSDCSPMKAESKNGIPTPIKKIKKEIKQLWKNNKQDLFLAWKNTRPTNQNHGHQIIK